MFLVLALTAVVEELEEPLLQGLSTALKSPENMSLPMPLPPSSKMP
jgi:hypothetical protein